MLAPASLDHLPGPLWLTIIRRRRTHLAQFNIVSPAPRTIRSSWPTIVTLWSRYLWAWHRSPLWCLIAWWWWRSTENICAPRLPLLQEAPHNHANDQQADDGEHNRHEDHVVVRYLCEAEAYSNVDDAEGNDNTAEAKLVRLDHPRRLLGFLVDAVMEEAKEELDEKQQVDDNADDLVRMRVID
jgi:hypothetical protein